MSVKYVFLTAAILLAVACAKKDGIYIETPDGTSIYMPVPTAQTQQPASPAPQPAAPPPAPVAPTPTASAVPAPSPTPAVSAPPTTPANGAADFKAKVEAKCLEKYPGDKKLRRKGCVALRMSAVRLACKLAGEGKADELCQKHPDYCSPEVKELVNEGLAFCDALGKEKEE